jgi:1-aminocyclopropane-1-carboxylate deaminase/D-cysteine desulfhydrase-like pyridoxal-dependent ACC family enzyme
VKFVRVVGIQKWMGAGLTMTDFVTDPISLTPVEQHGPFWLKRDDLFTVAGARGGKVRGCLILAQRANYAGLITASSRSSPQAQIVARIANALGIPARLHMPNGPATPEMEDMLANNGELVQWKAGYNNVIIARAKADAKANPFWCYIPFGMECQEAVDATAAQCANIPPGVTRVVVPVGSGISMAGVLNGVAKYRPGLPVVGVRVGADPLKRLYNWAPPLTTSVRLIDSPHDYHTKVRAHIGGVELDPIYEAKCAEFMVAGDLLWVVGVRIE